MAQASSVPAREPSMEEILASIRRIIEDSDNPNASQGASAAPEAAARTDDNPGSIEAGETADTGSADIEAFRSELTAVDRETELRQEVSAETPPTVEHAIPEAAEPLMPDAETVSASAQPEPAAYEPPAPQGPEEAEETPAAQPEPRGEVAHHEPAKDQAPARASIISETAERQVAAAFEELSDAFASSQRRSFDDIAEDLMRPMLQDWLDNNLPVLVERLVREEIERVARGAAR
jgi:cell pole-organizing protein PopZ